MSLLANAQRESALSNAKPHRRACRRQVFGDYISIYIQRAVADKVTVPIYYESRI